MSSGEPFPVTAETPHRAASKMKRLNTCVVERGGRFHPILSSDFNVIYFLKNRTRQEWDA
jgi:hypothetical protein